LVESFKLAFGRANVELVFFPRSLGYNFTQRTESKQSGRRTDVFWPRYIWRTGRSQLLQKWQRSKEQV